MEESISDKEHIGYILGSIEHILAWTSQHDEESFTKDIMTNDAVRFRLNCIGRAAKMISTDFKNSTSNFPWHLLIILECIDDPDEIIWEIINGHDIGSLNESFSELENIYLKNFTSQKEIKSQSANNKLSLNYKYPITTKHSIWTVKKR